MTYLNPIYVFGRENSLPSVEEVGISGVIVPDMPIWRKKGELASVANKHGVEVVSLVAPTSENRIEMIEKTCRRRFCVLRIFPLVLQACVAKLNMIIKSIVETIRKICRYSCSCWFWYF